MIRAQNSNSKTPDATRFADWPSLERDAHHLSDAELLELYQRSKSAIAFSELLRRYSPLVASIVRRMLSNSQDAEDAFQATFLIFLVSADKIRKAHSLASWLYGVAFRTAKRTRSQRNRAQQHVQSEANMPADTTPEPSTGPSEDPLTLLLEQLHLEVMDEELTRLHQPLREILIEHYIRGATVPQIAQQMNLSVSAVEGRLKRGRKLLRTRMAMRGLSLSIVAAAYTQFQQQVAAADAAIWSESILEQATAPDGSLFDPLTDTSLFPLKREIVDLIHGEISMKMLSSLTMALSMGTLAVIAVGYGLSMSSNASVGNPASRNSVVAMNASNGDELAQFDDGEPEASNVPLPQDDPFGTDDPPAGGGSAGGLGAPAPVVKQVPGIGSSGSGGLGAGAPGTGAPGVGGAIAGRGPTADAGGKNNAERRWKKPDGALPSWLKQSSGDSAANDRIRNALNQQSEFSLPNSTLGNFITFLKEQFNVPIVIDSNGIEEEGQSLDSPISLVVPEIKARNAMLLVLEPLNLSYSIDKEVLTISNIKNCSNLTRCYDLSYIVDDPKMIGTIMRTIEAMVQPDRWTAAGGTSSMMRVGSQLFIKTTEVAHLEIEELLQLIAQQPKENLFPGAEADSGLMGGGGMAGGGMMGGMGGGGFGGGGFGGGGLGGGGLGGGGMMGGGGRTAPGTPPGQPNTVPGSGTPIEGGASGAPGGAAGGGGLPGGFGGSTLY